MEGNEVEQGMGRVRKVGEQEVSEGERGPKNRVSDTQTYDFQLAMEVDRMNLRDMFRLLLLMGMGSYCDRDGREIRVGMYGYSFY